MSPSTQFAAYNKIKSKKDMLIYPDFGHEHIRGLADRIYSFSWICDIGWDVQKRYDFLTPNLKMYTMNP